MVSCFALHMFLLANLFDNWQDCVKKVFASRNGLGMLNTLVYILYLA